MRRSSTTGYTLIEVLIAAAILLVSMTGLITMQLLSIRITQNSYHRALATSLAYEMTEYIRANCGVAGSQSVDYLGQTLCQAGRRAENDSRVCSIDEPSDIVANSATIVDDDLSAWWNALAASGIPKWYATIAQQNGVLYVIVQWDDTHETATDADSSETKSSCIGGTVPSPMEEVCLATVPC
jgi:type IV pilus modification protein PilV